MSLFKLHPIGVGTPKVESLASYFVRLASIHALSPNELRALVLNRYSDDFRCADEFVRPEYAIPQLNHLIRPTSFNAELVRDLEAATDIGGLSATTFLVLGREFGRQRGVFRDNVAWCPLCFDEEIAFGQQPYWHLVWGLKDYSKCHLHDCNLEDKCPSCGAWQNTLSMRGCLSSCFSCGTRLNTRAGAKASPASDTVYVQDLVGLVAGISENPTLALRQEAARKCVDALFDEVWRREEERRLWELVPRDDCISIVCGDKELTLPVLRRVAYRLGVSLYGILTGKVEPVNKVLDPAWLIDLPPNLRPRPKRRRINRTKLLERLEAARRSFDEPPALSRVASRAKTSTGAIEYHFPAFAQDVKTAYRQFRDDKRQRNEEIGRTLIFRYLAESSRVSKKSAQRYVASKSNLSKNHIRRLVTRYLSRSSLSTSYRE